jgi:hypothetical protein
MNGLLLFCAYMSVVYVPWDMLAKDLDDAQEVWFGYLLTGWAARLTEPLHWLIYGAGTVGFWKMRSWMHPWASLYTLQVALGMLIWSITDERGGGLLTGGLVALPFLVLAVLLWRARACWQPRQ